MSYIERWIVELSRIGETRMRDKSHFWRRIRNWTSPDLLRQDFPFVPLFLSHFILYFLLFAFGQISVKENNSLRSFKSSPFISLDFFRRRRKYRQILPQSNNIHAKIRVNEWKSTRVPKEMFIHKSNTLSTFSREVICIYLISFFGKVRHASQNYGKGSNKKRRYFLFLKVETTTFKNPTANRAEINITQPAAAAKKLLPTK